jgi:putative hemolysin
MLRLPRRVQQSFQADEGGRACVHQDYRNTAASFFLWKGIGSYATLCYARYLIGLQVLTSQDENEGMALYRALCDKYSFDAGTLLFLSVGFYVRHRARQFV